MSSSPKDKHLPGISKLLYACLFYVQIRCCIILKLLENEQVAMETDVKRPVMHRVFHIIMYLE